MGSLVESRYVSIRKRLDEYGYREAFSVDSLPLVEHIFLDLLKTTENLKKYVQESRKFKKISEELQAGVQPFKEESLRLIKENSHLRLTLQRNQEKLDEKLQESKSRLRDLESENAELKLLISQLVERVKEQTVESLAKTRKMAQLQERNLQASIIIPEGTKNNVLIQRQQMQIDEFSPKLCPHCVRIRNFARFGQKPCDIAALDYMKIADSRIEALTLQNRSLKSTQEDLMELLKSMKAGVEMREAELENLKLHMTNVTLSYGDGDQNVEDCVGKDAQVALKSAQLQLQLLQKRNLNLERKLQNNLLQEHDVYMSNRNRSTAERNFIAASLMNGECMFLGNENISMDEKLRLLEAQLSHCCQEKAELKSLLADCQRKHTKQTTTPDRDHTPSRMTKSEIDMNEHPTKLPRTSESKKPVKSQSKAALTTKTHSHVPRSDMKKSSSSNTKNVSSNASKFPTTNFKGAKSKPIVDETRRKRPSSLSQFSRIEGNKVDSKAYNSTRDKEQQHLEEEEEGESQESTEESEEEQEQELENLRISNDVIERPFMLHAEYDNPPSRSSSQGLKGFASSKKSSESIIGKNSESNKFNSKGNSSKRPSEESLMSKRSSSKTGNQYGIEDKSERPFRLSTEYDNLPSKTSSQGLKGFNSSKKSSESIIDRDAESNKFPSRGSNSSSKRPSEEAIIGKGRPIKQNPIEEMSEAEEEEEPYNEVDENEEEEENEMSDSIPLNGYDEEPRRLLRPDKNGGSKTSSAKLPLTSKSSKNSISGRPSLSSVPSKKISTIARGSNSKPNSNEIIQESSSKSKDPKKDDGNEDPRRKKSSTDSKKLWDKSIPKKMSSSSSVLKKKLSSQARTSSTDLQPHSSESEEEEEIDVEEPVGQPFVLHGEYEEPKNVLLKSAQSKYTKKRSQNIDDDKKRKTSQKDLGRDKKPKEKHQQQQKEQKQTNVEFPSDQEEEEDAEDEDKGQRDHSDNEEDLNHQVSPLKKSSSSSLNKRSSPTRKSRTSQQQQQEAAPTAKPVSENKDNRKSLTRQPSTSIKPSSKDSSKPEIPSYDDLDAYSSDGEYDAQTEENQPEETSGPGFQLNAEYNELPFNESSQSLKQKRSKGSSSSENLKQQQGTPSYTVQRKRDSSSEKGGLKKDMSKGRRLEQPIIELSGDEDDDDEIRREDEIEEGRAPRRGRIGDNKKGQNENPENEFDRDQEDGHKKKRDQRPEHQSTKPPLKKDSSSDSKKSVHKQPSTAGPSYKVQSKTAPTNAKSSKLPHTQEDEFKQPTQYTSTIPEKDKSPPSIKNSLSKIESQIQYILPYDQAMELDNPIESEQRFGTTDYNDLDQDRNRFQQPSTSTSGGGSANRRSSIKDITANRQPPSFKNTGFFGGGSNSDPKGTTNKKPSATSLKSQPSMNKKISESYTAPPPTHSEADYVPLSDVADSRMRGPSYGRQPEHQSSRDSYSRDKNRPGYDGVPSDFKRQFTDPYATGHDDYLNPAGGSGGGPQDGRRTSPSSTSVYRTPMDMAADTSELQQRIRSLERIIDSMKMKASLVDASKSDLENEVLRLRRALAECQEHGQQLKAEVQKTRIMLEQTEALLNDTQRKAAANYVPTQRENQELNQQVRQLMAREMILEREVSSLSATVKALDRDKDEMRVELDRKDEKLAKLQAENAKQSDQVSKIQLQLKNTELQLGHSGETSKDQEREMGILRRQIEMMKADLDQRIKERDAAQREMNRLSQSKSKTDSDMRNMSVELDKKNKETDELRLQVQKYIEDVRRMEELLDKKEQELEALIENYRLLSEEKGSLETQRDVLERETSLVRNGTREVFDTNSVLSSKVVSQQNLIQTYEEEISNLSGQVASLENQMRTLRESEKLLQNELQTSRELCRKLETKLDCTRLEVASAESAQKKLQADNDELRSNMQLLEAQLSAEEETKKKLEDLLAKMREKEYQAQNVTSNVAAERDQLSARLSTLNSRTEQLTAELERYRLRSAELQSELEKIKRQYQNEKIEREAAITELKRIQAQLSTSSTGILMTTSMGQSRTPSPSPYQMQQQQQQQLPSTSFPSAGSRMSFPPDLSPVLRPAVGQISPYTQMQNETNIPSPEQTDENNE